MTSPATATEPLNIREQIIVALDVATVDEARLIVAEIGDAVGAFKVGMQLFTAAGPDFVRELTAAGHRIFLDLKYHDIPNTVSAAGIEACKMRVWMFNVHAAGGAEMMRRTVETVDRYCESVKTRRPIIIGVTVLTSSDDRTLGETGVQSEVVDQVSRLARLAFEVGLDGVVASPKEVAIVREAVSSSRFITVTPGIRGAHATSDDQRRVSTIGEALAGGSNYVVVGRPILSAANRRDAVENLLRRPVSTDDHLSDN